MAVHVGGRGPNHLVRVGSFYPDATLALDFLSGRYRNGAGSGASGDFSSLPNLTVSRASVGYDLAGTMQFPANVARIVPGFGLLVEEARTNLFLNSFAPATQTVTITATSYTITVWGSGSVTVAAGTATISNGGAASAGSPRTIGCTVGGTITVTVSGSPSIVQVEAGTSGTSPIPTTGATATRAADNISISGMSSQTGTLYAEALDTVNQNFVQAAGFSDSAAPGNLANRITMGWAVSVTSFRSTISGGSTFVADTTVPTVGTVVKLAMSWASGGSALAAMNGATVAATTNTGAVPATATFLELGSGGAPTPYLNSYLRRVIFKQTQDAQATLNAGTQ